MASPISSPARNLALLIPLLLVLASVPIDSARAGWVRAWAQAHSSTTSNLDPNNGPTSIAATPTLNTGYLDPTSSIDRLDAAHASNDVGSQGDAEYSVSVAVGTIRASVSTQGSAAADFVNYPDLFNIAGGNALALGDWGDELTVFGNAGEQVRIQATIVLTASGTLTPFTTADTSNSLDYRYLLPGMNFQSIQVDGLNGGYRYEDSFELVLSQGRSYNLSAMMTVESTAVARINDPNPLWKSLSSSSMDAGHTARLFLDVLSPGGSYILASGTVLNPIPEPSSALLLGLGLAWLAIAYRRRSSHVPS